MRNFQRKARKRLGKRRMKNVQFVKVENGQDVVFMVGLKDGWVNVQDGSTMWQVNDENLSVNCWDGDGCTEKEMFDDLVFWHMDCEYREEGGHRFAD